MLRESLALAAQLPGVDIFLSQAGEEVLARYDITVASLRPQFRVVRDKTASSVPVGLLYDHRYHTVVLAPATSNTVAKCAFGISDTLPTNMYAQGGKLGIPGIVFACDTEPVVITESPRGLVRLMPRNIELENVERLRAIDHTRVACSIDALREALAVRLGELELAWNISSS